MAVTYLKKTKLYEILKGFELDDISKMKDCTYKFYRGTEWITFCCSAGCGILHCHLGGKWFHLVIKNDDDEYVRDQFIYA